MEQYTASNGAKISTYDYGSFSNLRVKTVDNEVILAGVHVEALREFFRAEEDERLGRWRWPENPEYVVYPRAEDVLVLFEINGEGGVLYRRGDAVHDFEGLAARAYFDAHPEPKPAWHDAKPGEVWELTLEGEQPSAFYPSKSLNRCFTPVMPGTGTTAVPFDWHEITAGRRVWPADAS